MIHLTNIQRKYFIFIFILLTFHSKVFSQLRADFSATTTSGCAPIVVQFTDLSAGNPTEWRWDLGNGVISYLQHPSATYFNAGTYHVKLVVRNPGNVDSVVKDQFITVYPNPNVSFNTLDSSGCFPLPVKFSDQSTTDQGTITNWTWDFGDGTTSSQSNPEHIYDQAGQFSVALSVTNSYGCIKTFSKPQYIKTAKGVKTDFINDNASLCKAPVTLKFTNRSSGPGNLTYQWDFGDGTRSEETSPSHTYSNPGTYTVKLVVTSSQGCTNTITKKDLVTIGGTKSAFSSPESVCTGEAISFVNSTTPVPSSVSWNFGDGTISTLSAPVKAYHSAGVYTIRLVNNFGGCLDTVSKKITVKSKQDPEFSAASVSSCKVPFSVNFKNNTVGNNTYKWLFGDGTTSTDAQPLHTYSAFGNFTVTLISFNDNGCSDTLVKKDFIKIQKPAITIAGLPRTGCVPLQVTPVPKIASNEPIASYLWKFGDGTTSTDVNPIHIYATAGNYNVTLIVTTASGCVDSLVIRNAVRGGNKPQAGFSFDPPVTCASDPVYFTDKSTGNVDEWFWDFGDQRTSAIQNPAHVFNGVGVFSVSLVAKSNTCADTMLIKDAVTIKPPTAGFTVTHSCNEKYRKVFEDNSIGATSWQWIFGDGTISTEKNPVHTYQAPGKYKVILNVSNGQCTNTNFSIVHVIDESPVFTPDLKEFCKESPVKFSASEVNAANLARSTWNFGDGTALVNGISATHAYAKPGRYKVTFTITDILGCTSIHTEEVTVYGPSANFNPGVTGACLNENNISLTDLSQTDGVNPIVKRIWNYGDGTIDSTSAAPYLHHYNKAGEYTVSLKVVDSYGCANTISKKNAIIIAQPKAGFISSDSLSCTNKPVRFVNRSAGYDLSYEWNLGDGSGVISTNPTYHYQATGLYTVGLVVTDKYGCKDSLEKVDYINISYPSAQFSVSDSFGTCPPLVVNFKNSSAQYTSAKWSFDDGNTSVKQDPVHYYTIPGIYYAKLVVSGPGGCKDSASKKIEVQGPRGDLEYLAQTGCSPLDVKLKANTKDRLSIIWDYSDGTTLSTRDTVVKHIYTKAGSYLPKMILTDANGCSVPIAGKDTIKVVEIKAAFGLNTRQLCDSGLVKFMDSSNSNEPIRSWQWSFGDGKYSVEQHPVYNYTTVGSFVTRLIATTQSGCKDTALISRGVEVHQSPMISITGALESCVPARLEFKGNVVRGNAASLKWAWNFGNGHTAGVQNPEEQLYSRDGNYQLSAVATDEKGCIANVIRSVNINPIPMVDAGSDVVLCRDGSVQLRATGADTYNWNAGGSLSCNNCDKPFASPKETTIYQVTGYNRFGCSRTDSVMVRVRQNFALSVSPADSICEGNSTMITASGADLYSWSPTTGLDKANIANPKARPQTSTLYTVIAKDNDNCFAKTATVFVKVNPVPAIEAGDDLSVAVGNSIQIKTNNSPDVKSWQWSPAQNLNCTNCSTPVAKPKRTTKYSVTVKNNGGCANTDHVTVTVICNNGNLFIPNTFSPNGDGYNDRFFPRGRGIAMIRSFRVFNRWGEVVFERLNFNANDPVSGWDGKYRGQALAPDVYIYSCEVVCENNEVLPYSGDITLIK